MKSSYSPQQLVGQQQANMDFLLSVATTSFGAWERILRLQFDTLRQCVEDGARNSKALGEEQKNPQDAVSLPLVQARVVAERIASLCHGIHQTAVGAQHEILGLCQSHFADANKQMTSFLDQFSRLSPSGSGNLAGTYYKSLATSLGETWNSLTKAAEQVTELTEEGIDAATDATAKAIAASVPAEKKGEPTEPHPRNPRRAA